MALYLSDKDVKMKLNSSQTGDMGESRFMYEAIKRGYTIAKPFGNNKWYDVIIDNGIQMFRVQVKTSLIQKNKGGAEQYGSREGDLNKLKLNVDVIVCVSMSKDCFYLIPTEVVEKFRLKIGIVSKWDSFKNNWAIFEADSDVN